MKTYFLFTEMLNDNKDILLKHENYIMDGKVDVSDVDDLKEAFYIERTDITVIVLNSENETHCKPTEDDE